MRHLPTTLCACLLLGCSEATKTAQRTAQQAAQRAAQQPTPPKHHEPLTLAHDFGLIPHGETREFEFVVDLAVLGEPFVPLRVHLDCQCGRGDLRIRDRDGKERYVDGQPTAANIPGPGEQLLLHITIDTTRQEATDLPSTLHKGFIVLQSTADFLGTMRISWPIELRFAMDAPVELRPFTAIDFGRVAQSQEKDAMTTLRGDDKHRDMTFEPPTCEDPLLKVELDRGEPWVLRVHCAPGELGSHRALISIPTSMKGYVVRLQATWKAVPDLEASPLAKISFRTHLAAAQPASATESQFVLVSDHDERRSPEFAVLEIVTAAGRDVTKCFAVQLEPIVGQPREHRLTVRYVGGLDEGVRATIKLTKDGAKGPFLPIELVVFPAKDS